MSNLYEKAGVSIDAGQKAVDLMKEAVSNTHTSDVLAGIGAFGGLFSLSHSIKAMAEPVLVASTDGVGTKVKIAAAMGRYDTIGHDLVNHCINDILCAGRGVRPLLFLDYIASSKLDPEMVAQVVTGIATACQKAGCVVLGGETAEMPGVYHTDEFDLVGTIVGVVDKKRLYPHDIAVGDVLLGFPSSGAHTNGFSLIRSIFANTLLDTEFDGVGHLGEALLVPHRCYHHSVTTLENAVAVKGLAHITGGGLVENVPRLFSQSKCLSVRFKRRAWPVPPLFQLIQAQGGVSEQEMLRVFNMGIGMVAIIPASEARIAMDVLDGQAWIIGEIIRGEKVEWI